MGNDFTEALSAVPESTDYSTVEDTVYTGKENILNSLSPKAKKKITAFLILLGERHPNLQFNVVEGARSSKRQENEYRAKRSRVKSGGSHQKRIAIDAYPILNNAIADEKTPEGAKVYKDIGNVAKEVGLEWGGDWGWDYGHFQLYDDTSKKDKERPKSKLSAFGAAFKKARSEGKETFTFGGKEFTTKLKGE